MVGSATLIRSPRAGVVTGSPPKPKGRSTPATCGGLHKGGWVRGQDLDFVHFSWRRVWRVWGTICEGCKGTI